jgi:hypothetical protein
MIKHNDAKTDAETWKNVFDLCRLLTNNLRLLGIVRDLIESLGSFMADLLRRGLLRSN